MVAPEFSRHGDIGLLHACLLLAANILNLSLKTGKEPEMKLTKAKFLASSLLLGTVAAPVLSATAQPMYWQPWTPHIPSPGFINPPPSIIIGGWWNSPAYGRSDIRICRLSDNLGRWNYGSFHLGSCHYYSSSLGRGHSIGIGFDLLGGDLPPRWISSNHRHRDAVLHPEGNPAIIAGQQQITAQQGELESLCRIVQANGAFVGTLMDESCFAAWQGLEIISADFEVIDLEQD